MMLPCSPRYCFEGRGDAGDSDGALEIVGEDCQAGFGGDVLEATRSEVGGVELASYTHVFPG
jgi:hypothetical protein